MIKVNVKKLAEAVGEAEAFRFPDMNTGTEYLYYKLYVRLTRGENVRFSELDFRAFRAEDIKSLHNLCENVFEKSIYTAIGIINDIQGIKPANAPVDFV